MIGVVWIYYPRAVAKVPTIARTMMAARAFGFGVWGLAFGV